MCSRSCLRVASPSCARTASRITACQSTPTSLAFRSGHHGAVAPTCGTRSWAPCSRTRVGIGGYAYGSGVETVCIASYAWSDGACVAGGRGGGVRWVLQPAVALEAAVEQGADDDDQ